MKPYTESRNTLLVLDLTLSYLEGSHTFQGPIMYRQRDDLGHPFLLKTNRKSDRNISRVAFLILRVREKSSSSSLIFRSCLSERVSVRAT